MAQRACPACGTLNNETATVCTACGKTIAGDRLPRKRPVWLWVAIVVIAIVLAAPYVQRIMQGVEESQSPDVAPATDQPAPR